jgi:hypothetical protein
LTTADFAVAWGVAVLVGIRLVPSRPPEEVAVASTADVPGVSSGTWVSPDMGVLAMAVSVAWRAISLRFVVGVMGGGVDADIVHAENMSDAMIARTISMCDFFI